MAKTTKQKNNAVGFGIVSYIIFIAGLIWYLVDKRIQQNALAKFHFKQSILLFGVYVIIRIVDQALAVIPILVTVLYLAYLVLVIVGIVYVAQKQEKELPLIGSIAKNFDF